ncbi:MAG TPA: hypothetical protein VHU22_04395 [Xanthobacteraceae bacterium]|jgi:hypothetical protein|nr:hypothetical protein [Xanthobacteraceae bacterium]
MRKSLLRSGGLAAIVAVLAARQGSAADVTLVNHSGLVINKLYISPCSTGQWGPNQLYGTPVESSRSMTVSDLAPGCYDLRVILPPWNSCVLNGVAVSKTFVWTVTWSTVTESAFEDCSRTVHDVTVGKRPWLPPGPPHY